MNAHRKKAIAILESKGIKNPDYDKLHFLGLNISRAKNRGDKTHKNEIDRFDVYCIGESQKWRCAITGEKLEFTRGGTYWQNKWCNPNSCVIDRIDSNLGYTLDNIQLLTHKANTWKSNFSNAELAFFSKQFLKHYKKEHTLRTL